jgi:hypothetical protein
VNTNRPAGWYHQPDSGNPDQICWWDGTTWTEHTMRWVFTPPKHPSLIQRITGRSAA